MKEFTQHALEVAVAAGASYADARILEMHDEVISLRNGEIGQLDLTSERGIGIRTIVDSAWGFAATPLLTLDTIGAAARQSCAIARASAQVKQREVELAHEPAHRDVWTTPYLIDPFRVPIEDKIAIMRSVDEVLRASSDIAVARITFGFSRIRKWFASTTGSVIEQDLLRSGGGCSATATGHGDTQTRSYPMRFGGQYKGGGFEVVLALDLLKHAPRVRDEAIALLTADVCPNRETDLILTPSQLVLQVHESVGHANELDRVLGWEADYAGRSFNEIEHRGIFQYGSDIVNLVADTTVPHGLATAGYDDDGVAARRWHVVRDGLFLDYFTTRETAPFIDEAGSNGCARAEGWWAIPITRIPNLSLMPGNWTLDDLIGDTEDGILMDMNSSWSIDQLRLNFQFGCEAAWEIRDGRLGRLLKNPNYQGMTPTFWRSCDAICNRDHWELVGIINCGKGQPGQRAEMSHGCSHARFRGVQVGIRS